MRVRVKMTRSGNIARHGAGVVELDLEEYLCGVVPAEIGEGSHMEALRAQAVAARTFALRRVMAGIVVDDTVRFQAYRAELFRFQWGRYEKERGGLEPGLSLLCK